MIKSEKAIAETISIPTKADMLADLFGNDWKELGLSINDSLGIKKLEPKDKTLNDKLSKEGGMIE